MRKVKFRKRTEILNHLNNQSECNKTIEEYCTEHSIALSTFSNWRKKYYSTSKPDVKAVSFGRMTVSPSTSLFFEIIYKDITVRVPTSLARSTIKEVVTLLRELS